MSSPLKSGLALSWVTLALVSPMSAHGQAYPAKPIQLVVPFAPGGMSDIVARSIAPSLSAQLGQPVQVVNRGGEQGRVGTLSVVSSAPDGYVLTLGTTLNLGIVPALQKSASYHPSQDLTPISTVAFTPNLMLVRPGLGIDNYQQFLDKVKGAPGRYAYATSSEGGVAHFQMELFKKLSNTFITHIPYPGMLSAVQGVSDGTVDIFYENYPSAYGLIRQQKLIPIAVASPQRLSSMPTVPTFQEVGLSESNHPVYFGLQGPKNLPNEVVERLNNAVQVATRDPEVRQKLEQAGVFAQASTPQSYGSTIRSEFEQYTAVAKYRGISPPKPASSGGKP